MKKLASSLTINGLVSTFGFEPKLQLEGGLNI